MQFKNMKIEINDQQPLDEIAKELGRLGYIGFCLDNSDKWVGTSSKTGHFTTLESESVFTRDEEPITITELKEMK